MQYIRGSKELTLTVDSDDNPQLWVDSACAIHPNMISHTGIYMTIGKGATNTS